MSMGELARREVLRLIRTAGPDVSMPERLSARMAAGDTPMVPALGAMSTLAAAGLLPAMGLRRLRRRQAR